MAICEECGSAVSLLSFDELCADCEHKEKLLARKHLRSGLKKFVYMRDVFESLPEARQMIVRNCNECAYARLSKDELDLFCLRGHHPRFFQPKSGDFTSGEWGWRRKCDDFVYSRTVEDRMINALIEEVEK